MIRPFLTPAALALALSIPACDKKPAPAAEKAAAPKPAEVATAPAKKAEPEAPKPALEEPFPESVDVGDFGSLEPIERADLPSRGVIVFGPNDHEHSNQAHWETYTWTKFKAKRWGKYQVRLTYTLRRASLGMQFRIGDLVAKKPLKSSPVPRKVYLGTVTIPAAGDFPFSMITPPAEDGSFKLLEVALIPAPEGENITQAADGSITLHAKDATTWSENMRYESKPEKNCLGFWTEADDFAEWEFQVSKPGKYKVRVSYGCGGGNHGSEVELKQAGQSLKWTTQDTGGFQKWQDAALGEIEIQEAGLQRLVIDPVNKVKAAVLDVQKVVLTPAG
jgi:hypothetical protein